VVVLVLLHDRLDAQSPLLLHRRVIAHPNERLLVFGWFLLPVELGGARLARVEEMPDVLEVLLGHVRRGHGSYTVSDVPIRSQLLASQPQWSDIANIFVAIAKISPIGFVVVSHVPCTALLLAGFMILWCLLP